MKNRTNMSVNERQLHSKATKLIGNSFFIEGGLVEMARVCGKNGCKCAKGEKHVSWYLSTRYKGKRKMIHIPKTLEKKVFAWVKNYKSVKTLTREITDIQLEKLMELKKAARDA